MTDHFKGSISIRWIARLSSIVVAGIFALIMWLAITNEDPPHGAAIPVLVLVTLNIVASLAAWRWERAGSIALGIGALCLAGAVYASAMTFQGGAGVLLPVFIYGTPFLLVGVLFWACSQLPAGNTMGLAAD